MPVEIDPGFPAVLKTITFSDDLQHVLLLSRYRQPLAEVASGTARLIELHAKLRLLPHADDWAPQTDQALHDTQDWARAMLKRLEIQDPVGRVLAINEDILGAYHYDASCTDEFAVNRATIRRYWVVIGLISDWLGCSVEDLTIVVLAHELAHAYTQLGADIEGRRWPSRHFANAETNLKEGLAQYYTVRVLERLRSRFPSVKDVFTALLKKQGPAYHCFESWEAHYSPEAVRRAMIEVRRWNEGEIAQFEARLYKAAEAFQPLNDGPMD